MLFRVTAFICLLIIGVILMNEYASYDVVLSFNEKWMPLSAGMDKCGYMVITGNKIKWSDGQKSSYDILFKNKSERILVLSSDPLPLFDGEQYRFIRILLKDQNSSIWEKEIEVDLCKNIEEIKTGQYSARGIYIMEKSSGRPMWMQIADVLIEQVRKSIALFKGPKGKKIEA
jgi:hypothetical protein